jgi:hypothetical protein
MRYKGEITISAIIILLCILIYGIKGVNDKMEIQNELAGVMLENLINININIHRFVN